MWVAGSYTPGSDKAYITSSMGKADRLACGYRCSALLTRFVTVSFPSPSIGVSMFFTGPNLNLLRLDTNGNRMVNMLLVMGIVENTSLRQVLALVSLTNTGSTPLDSFRLSETLPGDWVISPGWMPARGAIHVYYADTTSLSTDPEITQPSAITVSTGNPEKVHLSIPSFNATDIRHPLMPGQSILLGVKLSYGLLMTSQSAVSYPRIQNRHGQRCSLAPAVLYWHRSLVH